MRNQQRTFYIKCSWRKWANKEAREVKWSGPWEALNESQAAKAALAQIETEGTRTVIRAEIFSLGKVVTMDFDSITMYAVMGD